MKLTYVALFRWKPDGEEPILLGSAAELSDYSFFQRGSIKEFMLFTGKTVVRKTQVGARQTVKAQAYMCHVVVRNSHLAAVVFCDEEYPSRAAMSVAMQTIADFENGGTTAWKTAEADITDGQSLCEQALVKYKVRTATAQACKMCAAAGVLDIAQHEPQL
jgi:synaptobrevin homolog YKT6